MFSDNHLWKFLLAFLPAFIYSFIIYFNDRNNIRLRTTFSYILGGLLSIGFMRMLLQVFPHLQDMHFTVTNGVVDLVDFTVYHMPTTLSWMFLAFVQVAMYEEAMKALTWGAMSIIRKGEYNQKDTLFSTMFYSCMISVGFAGAENLDYFIHLPYDDVIIVRSFTAVITHMVCGLLMGYFLALSRLKKDVFESWRLKFAGLLAAISFHGLYDFLAMATDQYDVDVQLAGRDITIETYYPLLLLGLIIVTICGRTLLGYSLRYGLVQKKHNR